MKKNIKVSKRPRPNFKKEKPAAKKSDKQSRKSGKGTSLMHAAAKPQSKKQTAESSMSPQHPVSGQPSPNRADYELSRLTKDNC